MFDVEYGITVFLDTLGLQLITGKNLHTSYTSV